MDFAFDDKLAALREGAVRFAAGRLCDGVLKRDRACAFSHELWRACAEFGLQGMPIPGELGGGGYDPLQMAAVLEGIGYGGRDNGLVFSVGAQLWACTLPICLFGTGEQKRTYLPAMARGEIICANAMTEPGSGSDVYGLRTAAREEGGAYVLDGSKTFVTSAPLADLFVLYARTGDRAGFAGITSFLVPRETAGLSVGPPLRKMGLRTSPMAEVFLQDCVVPRSAVLGRVGSGALVFNTSMEWERLLILAPAIGIMQRLVERCVSHARERRAGEVPIGKHQAISHRIVEMELALESSRLLLYRAAWEKGRRGTAMLFSAMAKLAVSEAYERCCRSAIQVHGGYGYMEEYELERELRDALAATLYSGTSEVQRNIVAALKGL